MDFDAPVDATMTDVLSILCPAVTHLRSLVMRNLILIPIMLLSLAACELPTIWERTSTRTVECAALEIFRDLDGNGGRFSTTLTDGTPVDIMADSVRYKQCNDDWFEGRVIRWNGTGWSS